MSELILQGPFFTRAQAARRAGVPAQLLRHRPDLLKVGGGWLQEVYYAFQFDPDGVRPDIGRVVQCLRGRRPDVEIGDWLARPNRSLHHASPLRFLNSGGSVEEVIAVAESQVPPPAPPTIADQLEGVQPPLGHDAPRHAPRARSHRRRAVARKPAMGSR